MRAHDLKGLGAESHVVLPYARDQFLRDSVDILPDSNWAARFDRVLESGAPLRVEFERRRRGRTGRGPRAGGPGG